LGELLRILLTGGAGFIGSHLSQRLLALGHQLLVVDDLNDFYSPELKKANLRAIRKLAPLESDQFGLRQFEFRQEDICSRDAMFAITASFGPEAIIHLAARAGVRPSLSEPFLYERVNVHGTMVMLEAARLAKARRFVFASSSSVYGLGRQVPFREDDLSLLPISPYAATKIAGEKLCFAWSHLYGIDSVCLRFFTVFGPRQRPDLAIRKFVEHIRAGQPIPVLGELTTARDYTFVADIVDGIVSALDCDCHYEIFNLGNSHPVTLGEMIRAIEHVLDKPAKLRRLPAQPGDVPFTYADISKARQMLGYSPKTSLEEGLRRFVAWYDAGDGKAASGG
jgi:UDP-glucuronate 4-epimerase